MQRTQRLLGKSQRNPSVTLNILEGELQEAGEVCQQGMVSSGCDGERLAVAWEPC